MAVSKGAIGVMILLAVVLAGFGVSQFGNIGLTDGEEAIEQGHEKRSDGREEEHEEYDD